MSFSRLQHPPPATTIDEVIARLDVLIEQARSRRSPHAYFAALYRSVTRRVQEGIAQDRFEDGDRMARLDVTFANRYLDAYAQHTAGQTPSRCWGVAFEGADRWRPTVLQHLLLGMNAHINLDLAIAAVRTCPPPTLPALEYDFREINDLLFEMLDDVQDRLSLVSPWARVLDVTAGRCDELLARGGLSTSRAWAWRNAQRLAVLEAGEQERAIEQLDRKIAHLGRCILHPGPGLALKLLIVRLSERRDVGAITDILTAPA